MPFIVVGRGTRAVAAFRDRARQRHRAVWSPSRRRLAGRGAGPDRRPRPRSSTAVAAEIRGAGRRQELSSSSLLTRPKSPGCALAGAGRLTAAHGSMAVVLNVAGISTWGTVSSLEHHHWQRLIDVNLMGPIHAIETLVPPMVEAGRGGHLVNVSSAAGIIGMPWHAAYSASSSACAASLRCCVSTWRGGHRGEPGGVLAAWPHP